MHWDTSTIKIRQIKTSKELELPLLNDVGNVIIDYLKYGRPQSEEPYVFLTTRSPFEPLRSSNSITHIVQRAFVKATINIKDRKFGPYSLRHFLSFRMLEQHTILPVISEVLGASDTESTCYYLRIDVASMKQYILDVPPIKASFYQQKEDGFMPKKSTVCNSVYAESINAFINIKRKLGYKYDTGATILFLFDRMAHKRNEKSPGITRAFCR